MSELPSIFEDTIPIGTTFPSYEVTLTPEKIRDYVEAIEDRNPLYGDAEFAAASPHGGLIAPPIIASIYIRQAYRKVASSPPGSVHAKQAYRFLRPHRSGERVTVTSTLADRYERKERTYVIIKTVATNQDGEKLVEATNTVFLPHQKAN